MKRFNLLFLCCLITTSLQAQNFGWAKSMGGANNDQGYSIATDPSGNVYTTGTFEGTADFDPGAGIFNLVSAGGRDIFVQKLDPLGNLVWAKSMGGANNEVGNGIAVDGSGNVYTTGYFEGTADFDPNGGVINLTPAGGSLADIFVSKLDVSGNFVWAKQMGGTSGDLGQGIAVDGSGNVYTTGYYYSNDADFDPNGGVAGLPLVGIQDIFVSKLDANGNFVWIKGMGSSSNDWGYAITTDGSGNVYTTGFFNNTADFDPSGGIANLTSAGDYDVFVQKLDASGNFVWAKRMGGTDSDQGFGITVDFFGNIYTTGSFRSTADFDPSGGIANLTSAGITDIFISKLDLFGNFVSAQQIGGTSGDTGYGITSFGSVGDIYLTGQFVGIVDFDPNGGVLNLDDTNGNTFVMKLNSAGNLAWARNMGFGVGYSVAAHVSGAVYTTGGFQGSADFDPNAGIFNLVSQGSGDVFISKLVPPITNYTTMGDVVWDNNANWSGDGGSTLCGCNPMGVIGASITIRNGNRATLNNNAHLGNGNSIYLQNSGAGSAFVINDIITNPILEINGVAGTKLVMGVFAFPSTITLNNFASVAGTIVEFTAANGGNIPPQFQGNNYRNLIINGSVALKEASGNMTILENLTIAGGDSFNTSSFDVTVNGTTTITPSSMLLDNTSGGTTTFQGVINNNGVLAAIGAGSNVSTFNFNNDIINGVGSTLNLDCNCQYNFNKLSTPLLLQPGGLMIFGSNGGGSGNAFSDVTIGNGQNVTFNVTTAATLLIAPGKVIINNNVGVSINGNGALNGGTGSSWLQGTNALLNYSSDAPAMVTGTFDTFTNSNTVIYNRSGDQVLRPGVYNTLIFGGSGLRNVATGNITINSNFTVPVGITFQINGSNFTANGAVVINGTFNDSQTGGIDTFNNTLHISSTGTLAVIGGNTTQYVFNGDILNQGTFNLIDSSQWSINADIFIENQSTSAMRFAQGSSGLGTINGNVVILDVPGGGDVEMYGNGGITIAAGKILTNQLGAYPATTRKLVVPKMNGTGTFINATNAVVGFADTGGGTAILDLTAPDNLWIYIFASNIIPTTYHHVDIPNNGINTLTGNTTINGTLSIGAVSTLNASTFNINIRGDWNGLGAFNSSSGSVIFDGSTLQNITAGAGSQFENINVNNTNHVVLNTNVRSNSITFTQGRFVLGANNLTLTASPAVNQIIQTFNASSTSYVETNDIGRLARNNLALGINYVFPVGDATAIWHININPTAADNFAVKFESPVIPAPIGADIAAGSWAISGNTANIEFLHSGSSSTASKVHFYTGTVWDNTGIVTTVSLPSYSTNVIDFTGGERLTLFTQPSPAIIITPNTLDNGQVDMVYTQNTLFSATGGTAPYTFSLLNGTLPAGLSLVGEELVGIPTEAGTFNIMIAATDGVSNVGQKNYTLIINKAPQIVDIGTFNTIPLTENSYELFVVTSSGLPARYRSTNTQVATISSGSFLTIYTNRLNGEAEIQAFQDGNNNYNASDTVVVMKVNNFGITTSFQKDLESFTKIYPNPAMERVFVERISQELEVKEICLLNSKGDVLTRQIVQNSQKQIQIPLEMLPSGVYFLKITTNQGVFVKKITKY